jgi:transposase
MSTLDHTLEPEGLRRLEAITGTARRRRFSDDDTARVVEETLAPGAVVSAVPRRHGLTPQQVFTWRRQARQPAAASTEMEARLLVPAVIEAPLRGRTVRGRGCKRRRPADQVSGVIEVEIDGVTVRVGRGAETKTVATVLRIEGRRVIGPTGAVRVLVATKPVDFRKGAEGLAPLVRETMKADPFSGAVYVFRAKRADRVKLIHWDGTGVCLFAKRLEDGKFRWPNVQDGVMRLSAAELSVLLEGLDWKRVHAAREIPAPMQPR